MTTPHEQKLREALQAIAKRAEELSFEPWDYGENFLFEELQKLAEDALSATVKESLTPEPAPMVRLTQIERDRIATSCQSTQQVISATIDAMIAKNGGKL